MQKIVVISDTHQNQRMLRNALENEEQYSYIFHLGDDYEDLDENYDLINNKQIVKVPGIFHRGYKDGSLDKIKEIKINNWNFLLVHNVEDINKTKCDIVFYGHTHRSNFVKQDNIYYINPGHLKEQIHRGEEPSYIVMEVFNSKININFKRLDNSIIFTKVIEKL